MSCHPIGKVRVAEQGNKAERLRIGTICKIRVVPPCNVCHGEDREGFGLEVPAIVGQKIDHFLETMTAFRGGDRENDQFSRMRFTLESAVGRPMGWVSRGVWQGTTRRNSFSIPTSCYAVTEPAHYAELGALLSTALALGLVLHSDCPRQHNAAAQRLRRLPVNPEPNGAKSRFAFKGHWQEHSPAM